MKQALITLITAVASLPFIFTATEEKAYNDNVYEVVRASTSQDLQERIPLYHKTIQIERREDSLHLEIQKLK